MGYNLAERVRESWRSLDDQPYRLLLEIALALPDSSIRTWHGRDRYVEFLGRVPRSDAERENAYKCVNRVIGKLKAAGALRQVGGGYKGQNEVYELLFPGQKGPHSVGSNQPPEGPHSLDQRPPLTGRKAPTHWGPKEEEELEESLLSSPSVTRRRGRMKTNSVQDDVTLGCYSERRPR